MPDVWTAIDGSLVYSKDVVVWLMSSDVSLSAGAFSEEEALENVFNGCLNGLFVLGRSLGFIGHFLDQKRLKQGLYRHPVDDISYIMPDAGDSGDEM